jgi:hypothetical protein
MVTIGQGTVNGQVILAVKKAGMVQVTARAGDLSGTASLTITSSSADDWAIGQQRYNNGIKFWPGRPDGGWGGSGWGQDGGTRPMPNEEAACTSCHGDHASGGPFKDVDHTPTQTAGYSDQDLITIFTMGMKPPGVPNRIVSFERWHMFHQWIMSDAEAKGLVVYLRSLTPESQGPVDFGHDRGRMGM